ncbi:unnamed protein product [Closterium sp. Yama58-4]|nr:unnamed protein product [Closterium sp. Yama58-4]
MSAPTSGLLQKKQPSSSASFTEIPGMRPDEELGSLSWQVHLSKFVEMQTAFLQAAVGKFSGLKGRPTRGHWLKSRDLVTVTLVKRADPKLSTISLICGVTYEQHYVLRVHLFQPICRPQASAEAIPSRVVVACYTTADSPSQGLMNDEKEAKLHSCVTQPSQPQSAVEEAPPLSIQLQLRLTRTVGAQRQAPRCSRLRRPAKLFTATLPSVRGSQAILVRESRQAMLASQPVIIRCADVEIERLGCGDFSWTQQPTTVRSLSARGNGKRRRSVMSSAQGDGAGETATAATAAAVQAAVEAMRAREIKKELESLVAGKGPFDFLLDTGSSTTLVSPDFAYGTIGLSTNEGRMTQGLGGMGPEGKQGRELLLPDVRLGEFRFGPMQAVVLDLQYTGLPGSVAGIVGLSFLSALDMDFDFPSSTLTIMHSGAALAAAGKWTAGGTIPPPPSAAAAASQGLDFEGLAMLAPATVPFNLPTVQISVNGKHLETAILDMGSGLSLITTAVASRAGVTPSSIGVASMVDVGGGTTQMGGAIADLFLITKQGGPAGTSGGRIPFTSHPMIVGDLPALAVMGTGAVVGMDVLKRTRCVVCFKDNRVLLQKKY